MLVPSHGWVPPTAWQQRKQFPPREGGGGGVFQSTWRESCAMAMGDEPVHHSLAALATAIGTPEGCTGGWAQLASSTH